MSLLWFFVFLLFGQTTQTLGDGVSIVDSFKVGPFDPAGITSDNDTAFDEDDEVDLDLPMTEREIAWLNGLFELPTEPRVRKEYRHLTEKEREDFHYAMNMLKKDTSMTPNKFDLLASLHGRKPVRINAHGGPNFLGWHRVFLIMAENAMREFVANITIPYWDTAVDARLDHPYNSILWTESHLGNGYGDVFQGPFQYWENAFGRLKRSVGGENFLMSDMNITNIMSQKYLKDISYPDADNTTNIEEFHNSVHVWVGGQMSKIPSAAFDPVFYLYHCFLDLIWEDFRREQRRKGVDPTKDYPDKYGQGQDSPYAPMGLGKLMVIDGVSDVFVKNIVYAPRPTCSKANPDCGSPHMTCDVEREHCLSVQGWEEEKEEFWGSDYYDPDPLKVEGELQVPDNEIDKKIESQANAEFLMIILLAVVVLMYMFGSAIATLRKHICYKNSQDETDKKKFFKFPESPVLEEKNIA